MKKNKILALGLCVAMAATAIAGGTLAYFTDTDSAENVFEAGKVNIVQNETDRNGNDYPNGEEDVVELIPIVNDSKDDNGYHLGGNYVDKIVTVTVEEDSKDAYIRTHIAFPAYFDDGPTEFDASANIIHWNGASAADTFGAANWGGTIENDWYWTDYSTSFADSSDWPKDGEWNFYQTEVDGVLYNVYVATHKSAVAPGETTAPSLFGVYLDEDVNCVDVEGQEVYYLDTGSIKGVPDIDDVPLIDESNNPLTLDGVKILVISEATQVDGFTDLNGNGSAADDALEASFGEVGTYCPFGGEIYEYQGAE